MNQLRVYWARNRTVQRHRRYICWQQQCQCNVLAEIEGLLIYHFWANSAKIGIWILRTTILCWMIEGISSEGKIVRQCKSVISWRQQCQLVILANLEGFVIFHFGANSAKFGICLLKYIKLCRSIKTYLTWWYLCKALYDAYTLATASLAWYSGQDRGFYNIPFWSQFC